MFEQVQASNSLGRVQARVWVGFKQGLGKGLYRCWARIMIWARVWMGFGKKDWVRVCPRVQENVGMRIQARAWAEVQVSFWAKLWAGSSKDSGKGLGECLGRYLAKV